MPKRVREHLHHCAKSISCVTGVVLVWHGIGIFLEYIQEHYIPDHDILMGIAVFALGILVLYVPDRDLDELQ